MYIHYPPSVVKAGQDEGMNTLLKNIYWQNKVDFGNVFELE